MTILTLGLPMRRIVLSAFCALAVAACQSGSSQRSSQPDQPRLEVPAGAQSVKIAADPASVRSALVSSAQERPNPALDSEFGPSDNGQRVIRIRVRFTGTPCQTLAVQDLAVINNVRTALEQSFVLPGNPNTMQSLQGLKSRAEQGSSCPPLSS